MIFMYEQKLQVLNHKESAVNGLLCKRKIYDYFREFTYTELE